MYLFLMFFGILTVILGITPLFFTYRLKNYVNKVLIESLPEFSPKVSLILPCKGLDPGFKENIDALLNQDYSDYEIIFVTATEDDPAHAYLNEELKAYTSIITTKLVVAGISPARGQKINNMLQALKKTRPDTEVFAFVDSDIRPPKEFLTNLVKPLQNKDIGVTTGIRWYLPPKKNLGSILQTIWAAGAYPLLIDNRHNFAWGGANAIKKETFNTANIKDLLKGSISDTFAITNGVKSIGMQVNFVPQCVVVSHENSTLKETLEWTNRQTIISRVYSPSFWWTVFITYSFSNAMLLFGVIIILIALWGNVNFLIPSLLMLSLIPLEMLNGVLLLSIVKKILFNYKTEIEQLKWSFYFTIPLTSILIMINSIVSLMTNEISWRGIRYKLISPNKTKVL